ncbi:MAG: class I SAM-dependent methyltransferase [Nanoarchaeota archaeon]|nr:class I SAM-dependent methyltransferase [Nanoarchaeota archaeon]
MWESPIYKFEEEVTDEKGKIVKKPFHINVTYSAPRNLDDPMKALKGVFNKITNGLDPKKTHILDVGAAKLRNTLWLLEKGFNVWAVEFPELKKRLKDAEEKWKRAETYKNFHKVTFPNDFIKLNNKFDIILLINEINVMPIPLERFAMLSLCREKIKDKGMLLWHQWRGYATGQDKYTEENEFIDGYLMGNGPNHTFYVEHDREESHEMLYSVGFEFDENMNLHKLPANSCYSYIFRPKHINIIEDTLNMKKMIETKHEPDKIIKDVECLNVLDLYIKQLKLIKTGRDSAHKYHLLASRIFFEIFRNLLDKPIIENEINEGRGRIDIVYKNRNKEGIFKNLKELRDIKCPEVLVECKNYENDLTNTEYSQLSDRLLPDRSMLGFLLCRNKKDKSKVVKHCRDRNKGGSKKFIVVLDDKDLIDLSNFKLNSEDDSKINDFVENKIKEIID